MAKYLDEQGLRTLWSKIKEKDTALDTKLSTAISNETTNRNSAIAQAKTDVKNEILNGAGTAFDTLKELEAALGKDPNFATTITNKVGTVQNNLDAHTGNKSNPHGVTKAQVGLDAVVNTGDSDTPVANGTTKFTTGGAYALKTELEMEDAQFRRDIGDINRKFDNLTSDFVKREFNGSGTITNSASNRIDNGSAREDNIMLVSTLARGNSSDDMEHQGIIIVDKNYVSLAFHKTGSNQYTGTHNTLKVSQEGLTYNDKPIVEALSTAELDVILV